MKKLLLLICLIFSFECFCQLTKYEIKIDGVNKPELAKQVTDPLRIAFNHYSEPLKFNVRFDDNTDTFEILSTLKVEKEEIVLLLEKHNYSLLSFIITIL